MKLLLALSLLRGALAAPTPAASADSVASLPNAPALASKHYSGYLPASPTKNLHYCKLHPNT
jgi:hypothetical protein